MKRRIVVILCITLLMCAVLVSCKDNEEYPPCGGVITDEGDSYSELEFEASGTYEGGNSWFIGEVLEAHDGSILVEPHKNAAERKSADKISVSTNVKEGELPYDLKEGAIVCVVYNGAIAESYPAQINSTVKIEAYYANESTVGVIYSSAIRGDSVSTGALNTELIGAGQGGTWHNPIHKISNINDLRAYLDRSATTIEFTGEVYRSSAENMLIAKYDSEFFSENELYVTYFSASSSGDRFFSSSHYDEENNSFVIYVTPYIHGVTCDVAYWFAIAEVKKGSIPEGTSFDAIESEGIVAMYSYKDPESAMYSAHVTLMTEERYTMTFGALSSHIGKGTYEIKDGQLCLTEGYSGDTYVFSLSEDGSKAIFKKDLSTGRSWFSSFTDGSEFNYIRHK